MKTFLLLGGYGNTGRAVIEALISHQRLQPLPEAIKLVIAGRSLERAQTLISELANNKGLPPEKEITFEPKYVDASRIDSLRDALAASIDMVVVVSPTATYVQTVVQAILETDGVNYYDVQFSQRKCNYLLSQKQGLENQLWITDGGVLPGLPAAMIRHVCEQEGAQTIRANVYCWMGSCGTPLSPETIDEFIDEIKEFDTRVYRRGEWKSQGMATLNVDFGEPNGTRTCFPTYLNELHDLPLRYPSLQDTGFYVSGSHWFVDFLILPFVLICLMLFPWSKCLMGKIFFNISESFKDPLSPTILKTETSSGREFTVSHKNSYDLTGIAAAATLIQYLQGRYDNKKGLNFQGCIVETKQFFRDLERMGTTVTMLEP